MRSFIQYKAGATFYEDSRLTLTIRKNYIEYVFDLETGSYGVISLIIIDDRLVFVADCGLFFHELPNVLRHIYPNDSKMPLLTSLLNGTNPDYFIGSAENRNGRIMASFAILRVVPNFFDNELPISIASKKEMIDIAWRLLVFARKIYMEVEGSDNVVVRQLVTSFGV